MTELDALAFLIAHQRPLQIRIIELAKAAGARFVEGPFLDFLDPWGNRLEIIEYSNIQFTKAPNVMRGMGLALAKNDKAKKELADKGMAE